MFYSSRQGMSTRKQTSFVKTSSSKVEDGGNQSVLRTSCGSHEDGGQSRTRISCCKHEDGDPDQSCTKMSCCKHEDGGQSCTRISCCKHEDGNKSETEGLSRAGSAELLDISTSREDLSRCSCHSGGSNVAARNESRDGGFWSGNLRLEFEQNAASDDEQLKDELLRIFDRERVGLESYFKQKTENILQGYRRKQYEWEEKIRLERMEYEKSLAQEKIEVQQNYISEMTNLTKQFNQERVELESHYKTQIEELSQQFELRKKEMDSTIIRERTELKQRLEIEYQAMLKSQRSADEQRFRQQISELEESYKKKILELEEKLNNSFSERDLCNQRIQFEFDAKFEREKSLLTVEWKKRLEVLEVELGKEKERANKEERKSCESHGLLRNEISKKDVEIEKLRQVVETLKFEVSHKEKMAKEHDMLQQNIFLRGSDALPGKLREDFEKMLAAHREELERNMRKEYEGLEAEREKRLVLERETMEKQVKVDRDRMNLELEKERAEMRHESRETEGKLREEMKEEMERMKRALESEKELLREQVREELTKERYQIGETFLKEKKARDAEIERQLRFTLDEKEKRRGVGPRSERERKDWDKEEKRLGPKIDDDEEEEGMPSRLGRDQTNHMRYEAQQAERRRNGLGQDEYEDSLAGQRMEHTKRWVEGHFTFTEDGQGYIEDSAEKGDEGLTGVRRDNSRGEDEPPLKDQKENLINDNDNDAFPRVEDNDKELYPNDTDEVGYHRNPSGMAYNDEKKSEYSVRGLREENEGLKAKVVALQEMMELHVCYKKEASEEVERLRNTNKELKMKLNGLNDTLKDYEELKKTLKDYEGQLKHYEGQIMNNENKIKEYEDICSEYERSLQKCRQKIMVIETDRETSTSTRNKSGGKRSGNVSKQPEEVKHEKQGMIMNDNDDAGSDNSGYRKQIKNKPRNEKMMVNILQNENSRLGKLVQGLEEKIKQLEIKISEITLTNQQVNKISESKEKMKISSDLQRVRSQNKGLVNKVKDLQCQLQAMVDKLRKKKNKIAILKDEILQVKSSHRNEISELQQKLEHSGQVIERLQHESSNLESSHITRLQEELANMTKIMMEERVNEQRMLRTRSIEQMESLREIDRDKMELERKMQDAMTALGGYSERLKSKMSYSELASSQLSLNTETQSNYIRDQRLSKTLHALEATQKTSQRQNERLQHEKKELQSLIGRLCKSQEDVRSIGRDSRIYKTSKVSLSSRSSSISSLSSSCSSLTLFDGGRESGLGSTKFSSTFSVFD